MKRRNAQQGMTAISMLLMVIVAGFFALLLLKLGPIYLENYKVKSVLASLKEERFSSQHSLRDIRTLIDKRLYINEVRRLKPNNIKLQKRDGKIHVEIVYDVREKIMANVDAIVSFQDILEINPVDR